jgi:hypothetical protein
MTRRHGLPSAAHEPLPCSVPSSWLRPAPPPPSLSPVKGQSTLPNSCSSFSTLAMAAPSSSPPPARSSAPPLPKPRERMSRPRPAGAHRPVHAASSSQTTTARTSPELLLTPASPFPATPNPTKATKR